MPSSEHRLDDTKAHCVRMARPCAAKSRPFMGVALSEEATITPVATFMSGEIRARPEDPFLQPRLLIEYASRSRRRPEGKHLGNTSFPVAGLVGKNLQNSGAQFESSGRM
jgi:hypothetical protein